MEKMICEVCGSDNIKNGRCVYCRTKFDSTREESLQKACYDIDFVTRYTDLINPDIRASGIMDDRQVILSSGARASALEKLVDYVRPFCVEFFCSKTLKNEASAGSGIIISPKLVLTNHHVVFNKSKRQYHKDIQLCFHQSLNQMPRKAKVIKASDEHDIAICELIGEGYSASSFPEFASAYSVNVGQNVFTYGNPLGRGLFLSTGTIARETESNIYGHDELIHTNMSINGGNSGGALFDFSGKILGLMTYIPKDYNGKKAYSMSCAVTSNTITRFASENNILLK